MLNDLEKYKEVNAKNIEMYRERARGEEGVDYA